MPRPGIVQGPGWLGLRDAQLYAPYHEALTGAGFVVMTLDYRGFADSEGDATFFDPMDQVADIRAALTFLSQRARSRRVASRALRLGRHRGWQRGDGGWPRFACQGHRQPGTRR